MATGIMMLFMIGLVVFACRLIWICLPLKRLREIDPQILKHRRKRTLAAAGLATVGMLVSAGFVGEQQDRLKQTPAQSAELQPTAAPQPENQAADSEDDAIKPIHVVSEGFFGCSDEDTFRKISGYLIKHDTDLFKNALGVAVINGDCVFFKKGDPVFLEDTAIMSGMVKVRPQGDPAEYWTNIEAAK